MGVALKNGAIHECAGVAFVGVTANVFLISVITGSEFPFKTGRETGTAASAKTGIKYGLDNFGRCHFGKSLAECCVTIVSDILVDVFGVDYTAVAKSNTML